MNEALLTTLAAVAGFLGKSAWDLYWKRKEQRESFSRQKRLDFLEKQLSQFYWPLYLHLQKNNVIWQHLVDGKSFDHEIKKRVDKQLYGSLVLANHDDMVKVIESFIHLAQADKKLEELLLRFIRHVAIFKALRQVGIDNIDPIGLGEPWPQELFPKVEARTRQLQQEYDKELGRDSAMPNQPLQPTGPA